MRVPDRCLADLRQRGYLVFEGFLEADELAAAQEALWLHYPRPEEYFADPAAHAWLATDQWAGIVGGPWRSWSLNRLAFHPDLLDLAERFLGSADLRLYEAELWVKCAGAVDYDQRHHRDFVNHSLVVPKRSQPATQMLSWILLSDVGEEDGPTKVVPLSVGESVPYWQVELRRPALRKGRRRWTRSRLNCAFPKGSRVAKNCRRRSSLRIRRITPSRTPHANALRIGTASSRRVSRTPTFGRPCSLIATIRSPWSPEQGGIRRTDVCGGNSLRRAPRSG